MELEDINYITIATLGDAQDFGDLIDNSLAAGTNSDSTRGIAGGVTVQQLIQIEYITISTLGNAIDFGDLDSC